MPKAKVVEGVFAIHKPQGITSAQVVRDLQQTFNPSKLFASWIEAEKAARNRLSASQRKRLKDKRVQVKIGHGGTLDPLATGVLIAGVGKGTKQLQGFLQCTKAYEAVLLFGAATDTYDMEGKILSKAPYAHITREVVEKALADFRGKIMQRPPLFSALRVQGKRLYEYAREGKNVPTEIFERPVEVESLEIVEWLEAGSHPYKWPLQEAEKEEKSVAEKLLHLKDMLSKAETKSPSPGEGSKKTFVCNISKKRPVDEEDDRVSETGPEPKRTKGDSGLLMSGGLQNADSDAFKARQTSASGTPSSANDKSEPPASSRGPPAVRLRMTVTSGFYVRSLCHDLGKAVGSLGMMSRLVRTRQGGFELSKNVLEYEELGKGEGVWGPKVEGMLDDWERMQGAGAEGERRSVEVEQ
ncbi:hypothetical protein MMC08_001488 [Hypocenomyce scalaris]|nr:hypothetical protein [Hypocenomyce scalaris]